MERKTHIEFFREYTKGEQVDFCTSEVQKYEEVRAVQKSTCSPLEYTYLTKCFQLTYVMDDSMFVVVVSVLYYLEQLCVI
jgi:hypothetical protein